MAYLLPMAIFLSTISGCMRWHPGMTVEGYGKPEGDAAQLLEKASRLEAIVDTREGLLEMVAAYEAAAAANASSKRALIGVPMPGSFLPPVTPPAGGKRTSTTRRLCRRRKRPSS